MSYSRIFVLLSILSLAACSGGDELAQRGSVKWQLSAVGSDGSQKFRCLDSSSGDCRAIFISHHGKPLKVIHVKVGQSIVVEMPPGAEYVSVAPNEALSILARTMKIVTSGVDGSQEFNRDRA